MYSFYETIKKEVDLQDLVNYLNSPLEKLKLLQIKLQEYKEQNSSDNKIEIEELIRECEKLEQKLFPDLINNYCKLSLEFRNNTVIKEGKDKASNTINYTSKDLLLKNIAKLIEHIHLLDERFYKHFSFEFLVNSRIISDLGYQENYIDNKYEPIVLKNQYVFSKEDAKKIIDKQLGKNSQEIKNTENNLKTEQSKQVDSIKQAESVIIPTTNVATLLQPKVEENKESEVIFEKRPQPVVDGKEQGSSSESASSGISFVEITLVLGMIAMLSIGVTTAYNKVSDSSKEYEQKIRQERLINQIQEQNKEEKKEEVKSTQEVLAELAKNREKNNIEYDYNSEATYKKTAILMDKMIEWRKTAEKSPFNNEQISFAAINGFHNEKGQMLVSARDMIDNGKAYRIDVIDGKAQLKMSNVSKNECQYSTLKLSNQYNIQANEKNINVDNMKTVCETENKLVISEK